MLRKALTVGLALAGFAGSLFGCAQTNKPDAVAAAAASRMTHERLNAVLWMQTSAEFHILSEVAYRDAAARLRLVLDDVKKGKAVASAAIEQPGTHPKGMPLAVVIDIDETVLDNSPMSGRFVHDGRGYEKGDIWSLWVGKKQADFVPGAREFVELARSHGVEVFFVTNRTDAEEADTIGDLAPLVITDEQVLASGEIGAGESAPWPSEKQPRRSFIAKTHWIVSMVGDDLGDFIPKIRTMPAAERVTEVKKHAVRFGRDWFLIPNPLYGSWESVLYNRDDPDAKQLSDKTALVKGFE